MPTPGSNSAPPSNPSKPRLIVVANHAKPQVTDALSRFEPWLTEHADVVARFDSAAISPAAAAKLPQADFALILGGDGTLLAQARVLAEHDLPLIGVNFGKLGFLAEFSLDDLKRHWPTIAAGDCRVSRRIVLHVSVGRAQDRAGAERESPPPSPRFQTLAMNDAVITAGPPFRMIDLELVIGSDHERIHATRFTADGVIVATPSGSTAYNLAAGGPIVSPEVDALCITPLCPHSLAFRPIVTAAGTDVRLRLMAGNEGTTLVIDGQESVKLEEGDEVDIRRDERKLTLVHNPSLNYWQLLATKLHWAARPRRG